MNSSENTQISALMNNPKRFLEVKGAPGQLVRGTIVPNFGGKTTVRIEKDTLHEQAQIGSERRETFTRIRSIDRVGIYQSSIGVLLIVGLILFLVGIVLLLVDPLKYKAFSWGFCLGSIIFALLYFWVKYKYLVISSPRNTIIVFFTKSPYEYRQFAITILDIARELERGRRSERRKPRPSGSSPQSETTS
ncbi:MAG: hypothetical protein J7641_13360 [Cyanobacteria bacterium SID2]|nr:hypothetical protein [Cyanobacteria bacterium SID2]MBP0006622.1 hypothetical protein [Cyanobacteria bacterium SBC]